MDKEARAAARFWEKVHKSRGCWYWQGAQARGYGVVSWAGKLRQAHRVAWELQRGLIPEGMQLDHLCRDKLCVNPNHLEPVTPKENTRRRPRQAECRKGHPLEGDNLYIRPSDGARVCRSCQQETVKRLRG